jgi:2-dehydropantoate 2-reductase
MSDLKMAVVGGGAIGGVLAARLERAGLAPALLARGRHLEAIRARGLEVLDEDGSYVARLNATDSPAELGVQDIVFICLKGSALVDAAATLTPLIGPATRIVSVMNGVPWWFLNGRSDALAGHRLESVDPGGVVSAALPSAQCCGCVVHLSSAVREPGVIAKGRGNQMIVGASAGRTDAGITQIAELLRQAGFDVELTAQIETAIWAKLWGNMTMNPISAITGSTADVILDDPFTLQLVVNVMEEAQRVGAKLGIEVDMTATQRSAQTRKLGAFKTSMLQDLEGSRPLEIDGIVAAPRELAQLTGVATPWLDTVLGLVRQRAMNAGLYRYSLGDAPAV